MNRPNSSSSGGGWGCSRHRIGHIDYRKVVSAIGHTPLVETQRVQKVFGRPTKLHLKLECENPTRSFMDRVAVKVIEEYEKTHAEKIATGATLVTVGDPNFSSAIGLICAAKGYKTVTAFLSPDTPIQKLRLLKSLGVKVCMIPSDTFKANSLFYRNLAYNLSAFLPGSVNLNAMVPQDIVESVAEEFVQELIDQLGGQSLPHVIVGEKDIFGIFKAIANVFQKKLVSSGINNNNTIDSSSKKINCRMIQVEITTPRFADHFLKEEQGSLVNETTGFEKIYVDDSESYKMARRFIYEEGIFCGPKGGSLLAGALKSLSLRPLPALSTTATSQVSNGIRFSYYKSEDLRVVLMMNDHLSLEGEEFLSDHWMMSNGHFNEADMSRMKWWHGVSLSNLNLQRTPLFDSHTSCYDVMRIMEEDYSRRRNNNRRTPPATATARGPYGIIVDQCAREANESIRGIVDRRLLKHSLKTKKVTPKQPVGFPTCRSHANSCNYDMNSNNVPPPSHDQYQSEYTINSFGRVPFDGTLGQLEDMFDTNNIVVVYKRTYTTVDGTEIPGETKEFHVPRGIASNLDLIQWVSEVMDHHRVQSEWGIGGETIFD